MEAKEVPIVETFQKLFVDVIFTGRKNGVFNQLAANGLPPWMGAMTRRRACTSNSLCSSLVV